MQTRRRLSRRVSPRFSRALSTLACLLLCGPPSLAAAQEATADAAGTSPWDLLLTLRAAMVERGAVTGRFEQTYLPAGFSSGDVESGYLSMWLPRCLRWSYERPQQKNFLLCDEQVWFWEDQADGGRTYSIRPEEEPGLDLLLVDVDRLRERYRASSERQEDGTWRIALEAPERSRRAPDSLAGAAPFLATLHLSADADRVLSLESTDDEGNRTRFTLGPVESLKHRALFTAPKDVEWLID